MAESDKRQIFISHVTAEAEVADLVKRTLEAAFGKAISVFVSSDGSSLGGGEEWFTFVRNKARSADIVLVLLSVESVDSRWVLFEAGVGDGSKATVIPVLFGGLTLEELQFPLSGFQGRLLANVSSIVADVGKRLKMQPSSIEEEAFTSERIEIERHVPRARVELRPVVNGRRISFKLWNNGNLTLELIEVKAMAPLEIVDSRDFLPPAQDHILSFRSETVDGRPVRVVRLNTNSVTRSNTGIEPIPAFFSSGMSPLRLPQFGFALRSELSQMPPDQTIITTVSLKRHPPVVREIRLGEIAEIVSSD